MAPSVRFELLQELTEASGVPGYEDRIRGIVRRELREATGRVAADSLGNVVGTLEGDVDFEIVVAAHMDEIGFMVRRVDDEGFLRLDALGGWDTSVLKGHRVTVHTDDDDLVGAIGASPPHLQDDDGDSSSPDIEDLYVDVGLGADGAADRVAQGDLVTLSQSTVRMGDLLTGKALDDRVGVFAMLEAARAVSTPDTTVHFAATVQEEVGLRGARALGVDIDPDLALALDVTIANDVPDDTSKTAITRVGEGTAIKLKDASVITSPKVHRRLRSLAEDRGIPYQFEVLPSGGTDTAALQLASGATPAGAVSVPTRYIHSAVEAAHEGDVAATIDLVTAFLETEDGRTDYTL